MIIVDTHCHALPHWFEPVEVLLHQMNANGVDQATLVQVRGEYDNRYIMECVRRFPGRFSPVVIVDTDKPDAPDALARWVRDGAEGVRLGPTTRSPGIDPLAIWRKAAELGIPVSCLGSSEGFTSPHFVQVRKEFPNLPIIIEHLGGIGRDEASPYPTFRKILALAQYPNTYIKVHGLGEICHRPMPFPVPMRFPNIPPSWRWPTMPLAPHASCGEAIFRQWPGVRATVTRCSGRWSISRSAATGIGNGSLARLHSRCSNLRIKRVQATFRGGCALGRR